ncbi:hypothetical protein [Saccharothrix sp. HUAS TT1]|uniref:8-oxoguanine DNA glycosylase OGG fold protein n=1 Tax=unclassified Saccharothrix TaxID=2593673 RepID=UPI00345C3476
MTDLTTLVPPAWLTPTAPRVTAVAGHPVEIRADWWRRGITSRGLPGTPPPGPSLTRADVWASTDDVFTLLWRTLAWGSGRYLRQNARRLTGIAADVPRARRLLVEAAEAARHDAAGAYSVLWSDGRGALPGLGPSFLTKFLHFAGGGAPEHPCLILDRVVAAALRDHCGWTSLHGGGQWPARTYARYCDLLARWAEDLDRAPDELEHALFTGTGGG